MTALFTCWRTQDGLLTASRPEDWTDPVVLTVASSATAYPLRFGGYWTAQLERFQIVNGFEGVRPKPGQRFAVFHLTLKNDLLFENRFERPQSRAVLYGTQGKVWLEDLKVLNWLEREHNDAVCPPGESLRGWIVFQISQNMRPVRLTLESNVANGGERDEWKL